MAKALSKSQIAAAIADKAAITKKQATEIWDLESAFAIRWDQVLVCCLYVRCVR